MRKRKYKISKEINLVDMDTEIVFIPTSVSEKEIMYRVHDSTGMYLIRLLKNKISLEELVAYTVDKYSIDEISVQNDIVPFVETLIQNGLVSSYDE